MISGRLKQYKINFDELKFAVNIVVKRKWLDINGLYTDFVRLILVTMALFSIGLCNTPKKVNKLYNDKYLWLP